LRLKRKLKRKKPMEKNDFYYESKQKAIDQALWLNFSHRVENKRFGVVKFVTGDYGVTPILLHNEEQRKLQFEKLPQGYTDMDYTNIQHIREDQDPLNHWEGLYGAFATLDGEYLRFLLHYNIPLEKLIRYELAARGYDRDHKWCGFDKARAIWLE